jgi:uncharacterized protein (DUF983 family)
VKQARVEELPVSNIRAEAMFRFIQCPCCESYELLSKEEESVDTCAACGISWESFNGLGE